MLSDCVMSSSSVPVVRAPVTRGLSIPLPRGRAVVPVAMETDSPRWSTPDGEWWRRNAEQFAVVNRPTSAWQGAEAVHDAIMRIIVALPEALRRSLTWDQGAEMSEHAKLRIAIGVQVCFRDPHRSWQRGMNENTNGLLRRCFPEGTGLGVHGAEDLAAVAAALNGRPRKASGGERRQRPLMGSCSRRGLILQQPAERELDAAVAVVDEAAATDGVPVVQGLFQSIEGHPGLRGPRPLAASRRSGEGADQDHVDEALPSHDIGEVRHPERVRTRRPELSVHPVGWAGKCLVRHCRLRLLPAHAPRPSGPSAASAAPSCSVRPRCPRGRAGTKPSARRRRRNSRHGPAAPPPAASRRRAPKRR